MTTTTGKKDVRRSKSERPSPADDVELALARAASYGAERTRNLPIIIIIIIITITFRHSANSTDIQGPNQQFIWGVFSPVPSVPFLPVLFPSLFPAPQIQLRGLGERS